jgi:hypothetical protein
MSSWLAIKLLACCGFNLLHCRGSQLLRLLLLLPTVPTGD